MFIDSHCHLNHKRLKQLGDPADIIGAANAAGVEGMLTISCRIHEEYDTLVDIAAHNKNVWCTVGTHPHDAGVPEELEISQEELVSKALAHPKIVGIGESGLDYFYKHSSAEDQQASFRKHIRACIETGLPLVIHARDADGDIIRILKEEGAGDKNLKGVMHCFSSGRKMGEEALDLGFYISFSGIVTFKNAAEIQDFAKDVPLDRILIETDAPFLAPEPYRKNINEPALVIHTAEKLSVLKSISKEKLAKHSKENFFNLFNKAFETYNDAA